ncbi:MAG: hypothetical protein M3211_04105 [Actinomycetota bacterium]|nr:hypothetical protein [Actinomycetota bacterium]
MSTGCSDHGGTVVLLEGPSDVAAVRAVAAAYGLSPRLHGYDLVDMGGVTNIRRQLQTFHAAPATVRVIGMCDAGEAWYFGRALQIEGDGRRLRAGLADHGFYVCEADLEDELIRAMGPERVLGVLRRLGLEARLATFQRQPAWRDRPVHEQLHRFAGTTSGRKTLLAGALAEDLAPSEVPAPLRRLVATMANGRAVGTG